jgi:hypothetical protein
MKTKTSKTVYSFVFILVMNVVNAQENFPDDTQDVPVNDYLIPMLVLGIVLGFLLLKKRKTA